MRPTHSLHINQTFIRQYSHWVCGNTTSICCSVDIFNSLIIFQGCCALAEYLHLGLQFILFWFGLLMVTIHNKDSVLSFVSVCRVQVCRTGQTAKHSAAKQSEIWWNLWWPRTYENFIWKTQRREHFLKTKAVNQSVWIPLNCSVFALKARHLYPNISTSLFTSKVRMFWFFLG